MSLPAHLTWIEADRPELLSKKAELFRARGATPACTVERVDVDLADAASRQQLFRNVGSRFARVAVITEGLLVYLGTPIVAAMAAELHQCPAVQRWVLEMITPETQRQHMKAWKRVLEPAHAGWGFAPPEGFGFFARYGWSLQSCRSCIVEARRLRREEMRHARLIRSLSAISRTFRRRVEDAARYAVLMPDRSRLTTAGP